MLGAEGEVLPAFQRFDLAGIEPECTVDARQWNGVGFPADFEQQGADDGQGNWQLQVKMRTRTGGSGGTYYATHLLNRTMHNIQSDATPGSLGDLVARRQAR